MNVVKIRDALNAARNYANEDLSHELDGHNDADVIAEIRQLIATIDAGIAELGDPDEHLIGTPWDDWRHELAELLGMTPIEVSSIPGAYEAFNILVTPLEFSEGQE